MQNASGALVKPRQVMPHCTEYTGSDILTLFNPDALQNFRCNKTWEALQLFRKLAIE